MQKPTDGEEEEDGKDERIVYFFLPFLTLDNLTTWMTDIVTSDDEIIQDNVSRPLFVL